MTHGPQAAVFENNPFIDKLTITPEFYVPFNSGLEWQQWFVRRSQEYDGQLFNLSHSVESRLALVTGQTQFYWSDAWRRKHCGTNYLEHVHDICDVPYVFDPGPMFYPTEAEQADVSRLKTKVGGKIIAWVLGGTRIDKLHPNSAQCVQRLLLEFPDCSVLMFGAGQRDFDMAKRIDRHVIESNCDHSRLHLALSAGDGEPELPSSPEDAARMEEKEDTSWPVRRSLAMAQICDVLISPDSGIAWACAMRDIPKVMLLSHASPENITKHWKNTTSLTADQGRVPCWPCHRLHDDTTFCRPNPLNTGAACISDINVERIIAATRAALGRKPPDAVRDFLDANVVVQEGHMTAHRRRAFAEDAMIRKA